MMCVFALAAFVVAALPPAPAAAETSYKRLKRKLRAVEWHLGEVLKTTGEIAVDVLANVDWVEALSSCDVDVQPDRPKRPHDAPPRHEAPAHREPPPRHEVREAPAKAPHAAESPKPPPATVNLRKP